jgi:hypothetical protein
VSVRVADVWNRVWEAVVGAFAALARLVGLVAPPVGGAERGDWQRDVAELVRLVGHSPERMSIEEQWACLKEELRAARESCGLDQSGKTLREGMQQGVSVLHEEIEQQEVLIEKVRSELPDEEEIRDVLVSRWRVPVPAREGDPPLLKRAAELRLFVIEAWRRLHPQRPEWDGDPAERGPAAPLDGNIRYKRSPAEQERLRALLRT